MRLFKKMRVSLSEPSHLVSKLSSRSVLALFGPSYTTSEASLFPRNRFFGFDWTSLRKCQR